MDATLRVRNIMAALYLGRIDNEEAALVLANDLSKEDLAASLVDAFCRGSTRPLYCDEDGLVDGKQPSYPEESPAPGWRP
jgi:hypothetical protein